MTEGPRNPRRAAEEPAAPRRAEPNDRENVERRRMLVTQLLVLGLTPVDMVPPARREGLLPGSSPDPADKAAVARRFEADRRLICKDIAAIQKKLGNEKAGDIARITEASKKIYLMRLERVLRDAGIAFGADQSKAVTQPRVMAWKTFLECARLIAAVSGVATEPKVDVNIGADAKLRDVMRAFAEGAKSASDPAEEE